MTDPISRRPLRPTPKRLDAREAAKARSGAPSSTPARARPDRPTNPDRPLTATASPTGSDGPTSADAGERRLRRPRSARGAAAPVASPTPGTPPRPTDDARPDAPRLGRRPDGEPLSTEAADLVATAKRTRHGSWWNPLDSRAWDPSSDDLTRGRNAHHSNTPEEMREALESDTDHNWLEGDLRVADDGRLVMAHDADKEDEGLELQEWLAIGGAGERGLKVDVKEDAAIPELLDQIEESGIPDGRIMLNVQASQVDEASVREMRERFPDAWIALNPQIREGRGYQEADLAEIAALADAAGGRVAFPIRWDLASEEAIAALKPHGRVSIWTAASQGTPDDTAAETARLRARGVDGVIDLGPPSSTREQVQQRALDLWESGPVRGARDAVGSGISFGGDVLEGAGNVVEGGLDIAGDVAGGAADIAGDLAGGAHDLVDDAPIIGRWL